MSKETQICKYEDAIKFYCDGDRLCITQGYDTIVLDNSEVLTFAMKSIRCVLNFREVE